MSTAKHLTTMEFVLIAPEDSISIPIISVYRSTPAAEPSISRIRYVLIATAVTLWTVEFVKGIVLLWPHREIVLKKSPVFVSNAWPEPIMISTTIVLWLVTSAKTSIHSMASALPVILVTPLRLHQGNVCLRTQLTATKLTLIPKYALNASQATS